MTKSKKLGPFERVMNRIPLPLYLSWIVLTSCTVGAVSFLAYLSGELNTFLADYTAIALLLSFTILIWAESWIGNNIRRTLDEIQRSFSLTDYIISEVQNSIFANRNRILMGVLGSIGVVVIFHFFGFWYSSFLMQMAGYCIAAVVGFMVGEMFFGTFSIMRNSIQIGKIIAPEINIMDSKQIIAMKSLAGWGLQISVIGSIVGAVLLPAFTFAPWTSTSIPTSKISFIGMFAIITYMLIVFFIPTERIHQTMQDIKLGMESKITAIYMDIYEKITAQHDGLVRGGIINYQQDLGSHLEVLEKMHKRIEQAPSWPFDVSQVRGLFGSALVPVFVYIFQNYSIVMTFLGLE